MRKDKVVRRKEEETPHYLFMLLIAVLNTVLRGVYEEYVGYYDPGNHGGILPPPAVITWVLWLFIFRGKWWAYIVYTIGTVLTVIVGTYFGVYILTALAFGHWPYVNIFAFFVKLSYLISWVALTLARRDGFSRIYTAKEWKERLIARGKDALAWENRQKTSKEKLHRRMAIVASCQVAATVIEWTVRTVVYESGIPVFIYPIAFLWLVILWIFIFKGSRWAYIVYSIYTCPQIATYCGWGAIMLISPLPWRYLVPGIMELAMGVVYGASWILLTLARRKGFPQTVEQKRQKQERERKQAGRTNSKGSGQRRFIRATAVMTVVLLAFSMCACSTGTGEERSEEELRDDLSRRFSLVNQFYFDFYLRYHPIYDEYKVERFEMGEDPELEELERLGKKYWVQWKEEAAYYTAQISRGLKDFPKEQEVFNRVAAERAEDAENYRYFFQKNDAYMKWTTRLITLYYQLDQYCPGAATDRNGPDWLPKILPI